MYHSEIEYLNFSFTLRRQIETYTQHTNENQTTVILSVIKFILSTDSIIAISIK